MQSEVRKLKAAVLGETREFVPLLVDVMRDLRVELELMESGTGRPDLVFAMVRQGDVFGILELARRAAFGAPVVAVMPLSDSRMAQRASLGGAHVVCSLDGPLDGLRVACREAVTRRGMLRQTA